MITHGWSLERKPNRVVIIGASGFIGSALFNDLRKHEIPVLGISRADIDLLKSDGSSKLQSIFNSNDAVVAAAAVAPVKNLEMLQDNIIIIEAILTALKNKPVSHFINISSDAIYGDFSQPIDETFPAAPTTLHGVMHLAREVALSEISSIVPLASVRPTLIYGKNDPHNGYGPNRFIRSAIQGHGITLFGKGEELRDHVSILDVVEIIRMMLLHQSVGTLNIATGHVISFYELASLITSFSTKQCSINFTPRVGAMPHNGYRAFDSKATFSAFPEFNYTTPAIGLKKSFDDMLEAMDG